MKFSTARLAVTSGLVASLALTGCSVSSKSETTTSVSDGETTTTTTTTSENGQTTTETTKTDDTKTDANAGAQDVSQLKEYGIAAIGARYVLPEGFKFTEANTDIDLSSKSVAFQFSDSDTCEGFLRFIPVEQATDVWSDSFLSDVETQAKEDVTNGGGTVKNVTRGEAARGDKKFPTILVEVEKDGQTMYMEFLYFSVDDEDVHSVGQLGVTGKDKDKIDAMINGFQVE